MTLIESLPEVTIEKPYIIIEGRSIPADADLFYLGEYGLYNKIKYALETWNKVIIEFKFKYYNTISQRYLTSIMLLFDKYSSYVDLTVNWYYESAGRDTDYDMKEYGEEYQELINTKINILKR